MARAKRLGSRFTPTLVWAEWDQLWRHSSSSTISAAQDHAWTPTRNKPRSGKRKERSDRYAVLYRGRAWNKATLHLFRAGRRLPGFPPSEDRVRWTDQLPGFVSVLACPNHMPATGAGIGKNGQTPALLTGLERGRNFVFGIVQEHLDIFLAVGSGGAG